MQGAKDEVAGFGRGNRRLDGLEIAELANQDHIGVLTERRTEALGEGRKVGADLALCHQAVLVRMGVLDRIFDRNDMPLLVLVDPVDHRGEGRRLS